MRDIESDWHMLTIRVFGDKQGEKFTWWVDAIDSRGTCLSTQGLDDTEQDAKACMHAAFGALVNRLAFSPVGDSNAELLAVEAPGAEL